MRNENRKRLDSAIVGLQQRWGTRVIGTGRDLRPQVSIIPTGFPELDLLVGIHGVPLNALTLFSGHTTSGKLTLPYKILANAQHSFVSKIQRRNPVAILDLNASTDPEYLGRCGIDLDHLLLVRPPSGKQAVDAIIDLVRGRQLRAILVDSLSDFATDPVVGCYLENRTPQLNLFLKNSGCALIVLDEAQSPWLEWLPQRPGRALNHYAALHLEFKRERWLESKGELCGYQVQGRVVKNHWGRNGQIVSLAIEFNSTVRASETW